MQASNGKLYGIFRDGSTSSFGSLYEYDLTTSVFTKLYDFSSSPGVGKIIQDSNGKLYGPMTGVNSTNSIFEFDIQLNLLTPKYTLNWGVMGADPIGSLIDSGSGKLYGFGDGGA